MAYAIMQKELLVLDVDKLKRAFRALPTLTALDAQTQAHDAYGILNRGLEVEEASALQDALMIEGIETEVVEESDLPVIPPAKLVRQADFLPAHLSMYDPMGRTFTLPWRDIMFIAAGNVRLQEFRKIRTTYEEPQLYGSGITHDTATDLKAREASPFHLMLEIVLAGGVSRYSITADDFVFNYLGARLTRNPAANFALLMQDLAQFAPHAGLNRGAFMLCENVVESFNYPSKAAFLEEITWMLWRIAKITGNGEG